ncbi:hypothetical protein GWI72_18720 [Microvirga tunisiensis]|uniref:Uncharacterized protein n=2 Tax=Pannonibacter tanglangensis TaxID=2750084 RepID=A0ABW9ZLJ5_9HYPH|nr:MULTISPECIES: hypothetical protein [unclassified Pannonibacter]NBN65800.1 hypothetical protein [Pannonibacter sp. XCT-34]NBN80318.1 hypothetical protein [Pannonibacter sp. XCT-53]
MRIDPFRPFDRVADRRRAQARAQVRAKARARAATADEVAETARTPLSLPAPLVAGVEDRHAGFGLYRPDAAFLAHLIAAREAESVALAVVPSEALSQVSSYRSVAASPRRRQPGHVVSTHL